MVYDVIRFATDAGDWVNGEFEAIVSNAKQGQGNKPSKCDLCDPDNANTKVVGAWFGGDFTRMVGARVHIGGSGNKAKNYRGAVEFTIGKNGFLNVLQAGATPPPRSSTPNEKTNAAGNAPRTSTPAAHPPSAIEIANHFHKVMKKSSLLWAHSFQYASETEAKMKIKLPEPTFQALVSSLFITAKDKGLGDLVPALRANDDKGIPIAYVAAAKPEDPDAAAKKAEAERVEKERAEKAARDKAEREKLDEDVPF